MSSNILFDKLFKLKYNEDEKGEINLNTNKMLDNNQKLFPATRARKKFQEIIDKVHYQKKKVTISKHGKPWVVVKPLSQGKGGVGKKSNA